MGCVLLLHVSSARPVRRGKDHFWAVIRELTSTNQAASFTIAEIAGFCDPGQKPSVRDYVVSLVAGGIIEKLGERRNVRYRLVSRPREAPSFTRDGRPTQTGAGRQQMWNVMRRARDGFTADELAIWASTDTVRVLATSAYAYAAALEKAGLLVIITPATTQSKARYRLKGSANTGPKAPALLKSEIVFDRNTNSVAGDPEASESGATS